MSYSTINDLLAEFSNEELARLTGDPSGLQVNVVRIDYARMNAEAVINAYIAGRYDLSIPGFMDPLLTKLSVDLTVYNLFEYYYGRSVIPNTVVWRRMNAVNQLRDIQSGKAILLLALASGQHPPSVLSSRSDDERTFTNGLLEQFNEME